ncbi:TIGR04149 family rSAM-modified RiPP [Parabacteroides pacaensis]|uniref:TIGR04149 family rSAM-modified RiPP n=1 Tax=Parabacteroides pacaensis TaxID=2086575 RepID=UPI000D0F87E5|nr:TIGR04149 family rSAM-modified RiPP [Parabacteroides pacaensis]
MKKIRSIKLHDLSHVEMENKEMNCLRGGYRTWCVAICLDSICKCAEDVYGGFSTSQSIVETYESSTVVEEQTITFIANGDTPGYTGGEYPGYPGGGYHNI